MQAEKQIHVGASRLRSLLETVLEAIVDEPGEITIETQEAEKHITFVVVAPSREMGKIIGAAGRMARALRALMGAAAGKHQRTCALDLRNAEEQTMKAVA